jgi:hypothetical protein
MRELGSWLVHYTDGTECWQYDTGHVAFLGDPTTGEVPLRAIEWTRARELVLESQWARSTFAITPPPEGYTLRLVRRVFQSYADDGSQLITMAYVLVCLRGTELLPEMTDHAVYWYPDGTVHECPLYDCPDVRRYAEGQLKQQPVGLMPHTQIHATTADVHVT